MKNKKPNLLDVFFYVKYILWEKDFCILNWFIFHVLLPFNYNWREFWIFMSKYNNDYSPKILQPTQINKKVVAFQDWKILLIQYLTIYFILLQILFDVKKGQRTSKVIIFEMSNKSKNKEFIGFIFQYCIRYSTSYQ